MSTCYVQQQEHSASDHQGALIRDMSETMKWTAHLLASSFDRASEVLSIWKAVIKKFAIQKSCQLE